MSGLRLLALLENELEKQRRIVLDSMGDGVCVDFAAYRDMCGFLRGLDAAKSIIEALQKEGG